MPKNANPLVIIAAYDQLCTFEFGCAFEVFGLSRPEMGSGWYRCMTAVVEPGLIRAAGGLTVNSDGGLELFDQADTIVIPGWRGPDAVVPELLLEALRKAHARGARLVSICGGAFVLAQTGLLSGRRATTHWHHAGRLAAAYPDIDVEPHSLYVDEGDILTSAGSAAGLDLCIHVVRKDFGAKAANSVARRLVVAAHREGGQTQFIERPVAARSTTRLSALLDVIRGDLAQQWSVQRMAEEACIAIFARRWELHRENGFRTNVWLERASFWKKQAFPFRSLQCMSAWEAPRTSVIIFAQASDCHRQPYRSRFRSAGGEHEAASSTKQ